MFSFVCCGCWRREARTHAYNVCTHPAHARDGLELVQPGESGEALLLLRRLQVVGEEGLGPVLIEGPWGEGTVMGQ